jgi:peptidyl-prolyl cis-trans isomerase C
MIRTLRTRAAVVLVLVLTAVWLAAAGAAPAAKKRPARAASAAAAVGETVLVRVGKDAITSRMVQQRIDELPEPVRPNFTTPEGRQRLLERMVEEKVWLEQAIRRGVADRPEIQRQLEQQRRDFLVRTYVTELMAGNAAPTDSEAKVYYDEHLTDFRLPATVTMSHIQLKTETEAKRVLGLAKNKPQDWKTLVEKFSADTLTRKNGGALGTVTKDGVFGALGAQPALAEEAFKLGANEIGGPFKTDKGWHVIRVEAVKAEGARPFDQVRGQILRQLSSRRSSDFYQSKLEEAKRSLGVSPDSAAIKKFVSQRKSAREMFNEAQGAGPAAERIERYRQVLAEYPDSDVSPQAQFMVGFIQSEELKDYDAAEASFRELLKRYPKSELVPSAQWMIEHMRSGDSTPAFMNLASDTTRPAGRKDTPKKP